VLELDHRQAELEVVHKEKELVHTMEELVELRELVDGCIQEKEKVHHKEADAEERMEEAQVPQTHLHVLEVREAEVQQNLHEEIMVC